MSRPWDDSLRMGGPEVVRTDSLDGPIGPLPGAAERSKAIAARQARLDMLDGHQAVVKMATSLNLRSHVMRESGSDRPAVLVWPMTWDRGTVINSTKPISCQTVDDLLAALGYPS